ncbi:hypothetical protein BDB01DRAFT_832165 [Pilobolus umbonatus]|nr:hypothetical protein BDB01DRAFT_832165 [Pilobolus umbonatus]
MSTLLYQPFVSSYILHMRAVGYVLLLGIREYANMKATLFTGRLKVSDQEEILFSSINEKLSCFKDFNHVIHGLFIVFCGYFASAIFHRRPVCCSFNYINVFQAELVCYLIFTINNLKTLETRIG